MKVAVIGSGAREHSIIKKVSENKSVEKIYAIPGNDGMLKDSNCVNINATDKENIVKFCLDNNIDYVIVSPDEPLVLGLVDDLEKNNIACFGPKKNAAIIEGSKAFSKNLMKKYNIPTANYEIFNDYQEAINHIEKSKMPIVIKADGLALGKGVLIANTKQEAIEDIKSIMIDKKFGQSGKSIVIEEFLKGVEVSVLAFTDGQTLIPMISSMDHKLSHDNDTGLNTGGMGTIAPNPYYTEQIQKECMKKIFIPTMKAMNEENRKFKGCLYFGLMITDEQVKVIEYNCRFGDPETQVILSLLQTDLFDIMQAVTNEKLKDIDIKFSDQNSCCVIMASKGYPLDYEKGYEIKIPEKIINNIFFSGAKKIDDKLVTNSGRVLSVVSVSNSLKEAIKNSYELVNQIKFENAYYRTDIGAKALRFEERKK